MDCDKQRPLLRNQGFLARDISHRNRLLPRSVDLVNLHVEGVKPLM
jgi:hypothetical protein